MEETTNVESELLEDILEQVIAERSSVDTLTTTVIAHDEALTEYWDEIKLQGEVMRSMNTLLLILALFKVVQLARGISRKAVRNNG